MPRPVVSIATCAVPRRRDAGVLTLASIASLTSLRKARVVTMAGKHQRVKAAAGVDYAALVAHGYREPDLAVAAKTAAPLKPTPAPAQDVPADPILVQGDGGRWKLVPAPGVDTERLPKLQRPGADLVAAARKRRLEDDVTRALGQPGAVFDVARAVGVASAEAAATAAARQRLVDKRLANALRQSRSRQPAES